MIHIARWKITLTLLVCLFGILYSSPNVVGSSAQSWMRENLPSWMPTKTVNLGLDLQGGSHLLLDVDVDSVIKERADSLVQSARPELREEGIGYSRIATLPHGMRLVLREGQDLKLVRKILSEVESGLIINVSDDELTVDALFSDVAIKEIQDQTIGQSIEIVRRRVDETGTSEPIIQRQGETRIIVQLPGVDDPQRIKELIGTTAKLTFHLVDVSMDTTKSSSIRRLPMAEEPGQEIAIQRRAMITGDMLTNAQPTFQQGQPVVSFKFNAMGAKRFCDVTKKNVNSPFAIVLDDVVISAPNIREPICAGSAIISGDFTVSETSDLALLLRAGALPAPLQVVEERTVGPSLGADSVEAGKKASLIGLFLVVIYMTVSYGTFGIFANIALFVNVTLIFALLSGLQATLTLPGIAGIVLTIGMAVDANVLIFERIREEVAQGRTVMSAIDTGYKQAMSTIVDANLTTLIAAVILYSFGTGPVKGFSVTLGIGILTSFFSAIMVTRLIIIWWLRNKKPETLPM